MNTTQQCEGTNGLGSYSAPPERCEEDAIDGTDYCHRHQEDTWYDD